MKKTDLKFNFFQRRFASFFSIGVFFGVIAIFLVFPGVAKADASAYLADALGWLFGEVIFPLLGAILKVILEGLVSVAEYNRIINLPTVEKTWSTVRDVMNMFFIFGILLIAFSTILRIHQYEAKQLLPKLVLYAVLVNFSLTICGIFIDIAQVFTLTFVNAFKDNAVKNFVNVLQIFDFTRLDFKSKGTITPGEGIMGYILALILMIVTIVTIGAMLLILLVRILYLWVLSILSPFAFVLPIIPGGQKYAGQWWDMFSKYVITGPLLAFFIWLSLSVLANSANIGNEILGGGAKKIVDSGEGGVLKAASTDFIIQFIIAIGLMIVGLMLTSQLGGAMGRIAGGASNWMQRTGTGFITGRLGPTPMRWARERYGSWRGQRESIRKEKVSRFGQGASALQDWAINKNVGHALGKIYKAPAGGLGRLAGKGAGWAWRKAGGKEDGLMGKGLQRIGEWRPGRMDRLRSMERIEGYKGKKTSEDIQTVTKALRFSSLENQKELRESEKKSKTSLEKVAHIMELANRGFLGHDRTDADYTDQQKVKKGGNEIIQEVQRRGRISFATEYLDRAPELKERFDKNMKVKNLDAAVESSIYKKDGKVDDSQMQSDILQGIVNTSALTEKIVNKLDQAVGKHGGFFTELAKSIHDTKEMSKIFGNINKEIQDKHMDGVDISESSDEMKIAFGESTGHWKGVFTNGEGESAQFDSGLADKFFSRKENKATFTKAHGTSMTKDTLMFLHKNWEKYKFSDKQWEDMLDDPITREEIKNNGSSLVKEVNKDVNTYEDYNMKRLRNTILKAHKSNNFDDGSEIYEINSADETVRKAAQESLENSIMQNRISPERLESVNLEIDVADSADPTKITKKRNDNLMKAMTKFSHGQLAKMMLESQERGEKIISYMIDNPEANQSRLKRFPNDSNTVHFLDEEYVGNNKDLLDRELSIRQALEELGIIDKIKKEAGEKKKEKSEEPKPPPTSGGSSPFGV